LACPQSSLQIKTLQAHRQVLITTMGTRTVPTDNILRTLGGHHMAHSKNVPKQRHQKLPSFHCHSTTTRKNFPIKSMGYRLFIGASFGYKRINGNIGFLSGTIKHMKTRIARVLRLSFPTLDRHKFHIFAVGF